MLGRAAVWAFVALFVAVLISVGISRLGSFSSTHSATSSSGQYKSARMASTAANTRPIAGAKRVLIFGASGMVGRGVVHESLLDEGVEQVVSIGRTKTGIIHEKLKEIDHGDFLNFEAIEDELKNVDACFWSLGVSSFRMDKADYERITKDFTVTAANVLYKHNPNMTFVYVSGLGTDAESSTHWARIKGETENAIIDMPWHGYAFRPGFIYPSHDERPKSPVYKALYTPIMPFINLFKRFAPTYLSTTENIGKGFLKLAREGSTTKVFSNNEINLITRKESATL